MNAQNAACIPRHNKPSGITNRPLQDVLEEIKGGTHKDLITELRAHLKGSAEANPIKNNLPAFAIGAFNKRVSNSNYVGYSSEVFNADIDSLDPSRLSFYKSTLLDSPHIAYAFISPSGNGLKIGVNVSKIKNDAHLKQIAPIVNKFLLAIDPALQLDKACNNISRLCYVSFDRDTYINLTDSIALGDTGFDESHVLTDDVAALPSVKVGELMPIDPDTSELCCIKVSAMIINAPDGGCHAARLRAGKLAGGYVAGGLVEVAEIMATSRRASDERDPTGKASATEWKAFTDSYAEGLNAPIYSVSEDFEILTTDKDGNSKTVTLQRDKNGQLKTDLTNMSKALSTPEFTGYTFGYDTFTQDLMYQHNNSAWLAFDNNTLSKIRLTLDKKGFKRTNKADIKDLIECIGYENSFDAAINWADALPDWDGVPRVNTFMAEYFKTENTTFTRAVGAYLWTALVARSYDAGCKADITIVLCGDQGFRKSTAIETLVQSVEQYTEIDFNDSEDKTTRNLRGKQIAEISELRGLNTRDADTIKAFMTRRIDVLIPKFKERAVSMPRRYIAIGTSNEEAILADTTGSRRWLPVTVTAIIDSEAIVAVRDQLWAEGKAMYKLKGIMYQEAETLGKTENIKYEIPDAWAESVITYLRHRYDPDVLVTNILSGGLDIPKGRQTKRDEMRVTTILKVIGYTAERKMTHGMRLYRWHRPDSFKYEPNVGDAHYAQGADCEDVF